MSGVTSATDVLEKALKELWKSDEEYVAAIVTRHEEILRMELARATINTSASRLVEGLSKLNDHPQGEPSVLPYLPIAVHPDMQRLYDMYDPKKEGKE